MYISLGIFVNISVYIDRYVRLDGVGLQAWRYIQVRVHVCIQVYVHVCIHVHVHVCIQVHVHVCIQVYVHVCICLLVYVIETGLFWH